MSPSDLSAPAPVAVDRERSAARIARDVDTLAGPEYTLSRDAIRRYAFTPAYRATVGCFRRELEALGFETSEDPVGNFVARNRPAGERVVGLGSHCDSNRNGGKYDGTLGVAVAVEVCRLDSELALGLPLQVVSWLEEEASGFGCALLGSRIATRRVSEEDLREKIRALDDGRSFWEHAEEAGYEPARWRECERVLDGLVAWIEPHIEQGRVLQDTGNRLGVVTAIAGLVWADIVFEGRADHAGATPMGFRLDAAVPAAKCAAELERLAEAAGGGTVGTVGEIELHPGIVNVVPGRARVSLDIRGVDEETFRGVGRDLVAFASAEAERRGLEVRYEERVAQPVTPMDGRVVAALEAAAKAAGEPYMRMPSGAGHDTMCVADRVPSGMVFIPCKEGISHAPEEEASPADAALAAEVVLNAVRSLC